MISILFYKKNNQKTEFDALMDYGFYRTCTHKKKTMSGLLLQEYITFIIVRKKLEMAK